MTIEVRVGASRFVTRAGWVESRHCFSYGPHYDPENTRFGALIALNDDVLAPGGGFPEHPHRGIDIVTWVVDGELTHRDDVGGAGVVRPGFAQLVNAGSGVRHVESNASPRPTRYVQMWVIADGEGPASYATAEIFAGSRSEGVVVVASGSAPAPLALRQPGATLLAARLERGAAASLPAAPLSHVYVVSGSLRLGDATLRAGDAARASGAGALSLTAEAGSEALVWLLDEPGLGLGDDGPRR